MNTFKKNVEDVVHTITRGSVMTYKEVARRAGNEKASRAVGIILAKNKDKNIPCHRVVKSDGSIGMYNGLRGNSKKCLLKKEGVNFLTNGKVIVQ